MFQQTTIKHVSFEKSQSKNQCTQTHLPTIYETKPLKPKRVLIINNERTKQNKSYLDKKDIKILHALLNNNDQIDQENQRLKKQLNKDLPLSYRNIKKTHFPLIAHERSREPYLHDEMHKNMMWRAHRTVFMLQKEQQEREKRRQTPNVKGF